MIRTSLIGLIIAGLFVVLYFGLHNNPRIVQSPLIDKKAPAFQAKLFDGTDKVDSTRVFQHKITVLNVFASWCSACVTDHQFWEKVPFPMNVQIIGLDYKDNLSDLKAWLKQYGNPYKKIILDPKGDIAIDWGVYGTPETYLVDKQGIIRYKYIGVVSPKIWREEFLTKIQRLENA